MNLQDGVSLIESLWITLFSMALVFAALGALYLILLAFEKIFYKEEISPVHPSANVKEKPTVSETYEDTEDNMQEIVAAISAALLINKSASGKTLSIKNIRKLSQASSTWKNVGKQESVLNTIKK